MKQIIDQVDYQPNVPYQPLHSQNVDNNAYTSKSDELEQLLKGINIPDQVEFEHQYKYNDNTCFGYGSITGESKFDIQGIGQLDFSLTVEIMCLIFCCCFCRFIDCDEHAYPEEVYVLKNEQVRLEFWPGGIGRIFVNDKQVFEFLQTFPNVCDVFYSHFLSSYPKLKIFSPIEKNYQLTLRPDKNSCPENVIGGCGCLACFDLFTTSKNYHVDGLTQGRCQIINTRTPCEACSQITLMQGQCCKLCPEINYPRFAVQFEGVRKIDKIAIIMGLVHISFYKKWINLLGHLHIRIHEAKFIPVV
ncbi:unnamed protein product (macronuclear) [Paramecium tetraurelia]|uniref:Phospholipid scramblase n=1 Tax=Paramecium tetraurelia TaxID=5888 RepID=A0CAT8_PARTE|nr:uncharacterized protein GSPATT00036686001 [Paramecium tetraurelia]CAK67905.1 unnamed protein product [Paramecium tetraurelia]|eukprot:XP_001435302.1 hypothetical protein (macronuclear) [Paramecium tetraurelia strain d4-2]